MQAEAQAAVAYEDGLDQYSDLDQAQERLKQLVARAPSQ